MEINKQNQKVESNSTAYQAGGDIHVTHGVRYEQVKEIALDIFKSNFYDLGEKVEKLVNERAEEFINKYLDKLQATAPENLENTQDPDVRYVIYEAQKSHARRGDQEVADLMVDLLVSRTKIKDKNLLQLVCNEALGVMPKLTLKQIDILTTLFLMNYVNIKIFPVDQFYKIVYLFTRDISRDEFAFQHLQYAGCISISIGSIDINKTLEQHYPGVNLHEVNAGYSELINRWKSTKLENSSLTSVGIAIALSNFKRKTGLNWELSTWING
ncbi:LPO_1073/Vpar_1526 family protein [Alkalihalophilus marmarensis]|uniref:LPO_1073/Vpar_1526 family protein n=1 Tax=Alkalihalophilus marmarensis TaxID=521377 RepID=UPI002E1DECF1|nr:hypothetical protein [Alkalihalophilus marmarensis]